MWHDASLTHTYGCTPSATSENREIFATRICKWCNSSHNFIILFILSSSSSTSQSSPIERRTNYLLRTKWGVETVSIAEKYVLADANDKSVTYAPHSKWFERTETDRQIEIKMMKVGGARRQLHSDDLNEWSRMLCKSNDQSKTPAAERKKNARNASTRRNT